MPDDDKHEPARVYGQSDPTNRVTPPANGMRGEGGPPLGEPDPEQTHAETVEGRPVVVTETSGTAFAETTGRAGLAREARSQD